MFLIFLVFPIFIREKLGKRSIFLQPIFRIIYIMLSEQVAVLRYEGAEEALPSPIEEITWESTKRHGFVS